MLCSSFETIEQLQTGTNSMQHQDCRDTIPMSSIGGSQVQRAPKGKLNLFVWKKVKERRRGDAGRGGKRMVMDRWKRGEEERYKERERETGRRRRRFTGRGEVAEKECNREERYGSLTASWWTPFPSS